MRCEAGERNRTGAARIRPSVTLPSSLSPAAPLIPHLSPLGKVARRGHDGGSAAGGKLRRGESPSLGAFGRMRRTPRVSGGPREARPTRPSGRSAPDPAEGVSLGSGAGRGPGWGGPPKPARANDPPRCATLSRMPRWDRRPEDAWRGRIDSRPAPGEESFPHDPLVEVTHRGSAFEKETALGLLSC